MENSQVQNDLKRQFFVVLIMLGVFFVSDALCHDTGTDHKHAPAGVPPPPGPAPTDENPLPTPPPPSGTYKPPPVTYKPPGPHSPITREDVQKNRERSRRYPGYAFANGALPSVGNKRDPAEQTPQQQPPQPQQQPRQLGDPSGGGTPPTPQQTPQQQQPVSTPAYTPKVQAVSETYVKPMLSLKVTEYMLRDWIKNAGGGFPQWIEVYNPNAEPVNLEGYQFTYTYRRFANHPWAYKTQSISNVMIPAQGAVIITNKLANTRHNVIAGIPNERVWVIPNGNRSIQLKNGWHLADPNGEVVHRIGHAFRESPSTDPSDWDSTLGHPHLPTHTEAGHRVSYQWPASEAPAEAHFYGNATDVGSPGFYEPAVPKAPSLVIRKKVGTWAALKSK